MESEPAIKTNETRAALAEGLRVHDTRSPRDPIIDAGKRRLKFGQKNLEHPVATL
jgi:hypothetical protein